MPPVYATPMMVLAMGIRLVGRSSTRFAARLGDGRQQKSNIRHLAPTPVGRTVTATATVTAVEGRESSTFAVEAHDGVRKKIRRGGRTSVALSNSGALRRAYGGGLTRAQSPRGAASVCRIIRKVAAPPHFWVKYDEKRGVKPAPQKEEGHARANSRRRLHIRWLCAPAGQLSRPMSMLRSTQRSDPPMPRADSPL